MKENTNTTTKTIRSGKMIISFLTVLFLLLGTSSFAQEVENESATAEDKFNEWDSDYDKRWSRDEFGTALGEVGFSDDWDKDDDGAFSRDEINEGIFNVYNNDGDEFLNEEEFNAWNTSWRGNNEFSDWDTNDDEVLDYEEYGNGLNNVRIIEDWDVDDDDIFTEDEVSEGLFETWDENDDDYMEYGEYDAGVFDNWPKD